MIAAVTPPAVSSRLLFNAFDVALVLILAFGFWRGRKNGMTKELLPFSQWLVIVFAAGLGYELLGDLLIQSHVVKSVFGTNFNEKTAAYISAYLIITGVVWIIFAFIRKHLKEKLEGSNVFGSGEYYLGILCGMVRYACMVLFALALLNAPYYSQEEIAARQAYNNRWYGGGLKDFKGDFIPSLDEMQAGVFKNSLTGPFIKKGAGVLLINNVPASSSAKPPVISIQ
jgi:hypothetical protein